MEKMILQINGSIFSGTTDGKYFYFNMIDRAEMGDKVQLAEPVKANEAVDPSQPEINIEEGVHEDDVLYQIVQQLQQGFTSGVIQGSDSRSPKGGGWRGSWSLKVSAWLNASKPEVKADEVVDTFVMDTPIVTDPVITEPVAEEIKEIVEEKTDVELLKDVKEDIAKAEQGVEEMIKREEGEAVEEIEPIVGPIEEPIGETMLPEPMVAGAKKTKPARKFVVDPTEVGKKDMVKK